MRAIIQKIDSFRLEKWIFDRFPETLRISENGDMLIHHEKTIRVYDRNGALKMNYEHDSILHLSYFSKDHHLLFVTRELDVYELDTRDLSTRLAFSRKASCFKRMISGKFLLQDEGGLCVLDRNLAELFRWKGKKIKFIQESIEGVYHIVFFKEDIHQNTVYAQSISNVFGGTLDTRATKWKTEYDEKDFRKLLDFDVFCNWFKIVDMDSNRLIYALRQFGENYHDYFCSWDLKLDELSVWKGEMLVNEDFYYLIHLDRFILSIVPPGTRFKLGKLATKTRVLLCDLESNVLRQVILKGEQGILLDQKRKNIVALGCSGLISVYRVCARFAYFFFIIIFFPF